MMVYSPEQAVRETDYDALSSRLSCYMKGYNPEDGYVLKLIPLILYYQLASVESDLKRFALSRKIKSQFFNLFQTSHTNVATILEQKPQTVFSKINRFTPLKSPMINRGTYLRTKCITNHIDAFISRYSSRDRIQIVSLGAGNDTRAFNLLPAHPNLHYFELDVEQTARLKKLAILSSPALSQAVGATSLATEQLPTTSGQIATFDPTLHTANYHLIPCDLRTLGLPHACLESLAEMSSIDREAPTLLLSECCICYLTKSDSNNLISFWRRSLSQGCFLIYEPLGGSLDASSSYGQVMVKNLICRGIEMPTLMEYGTVDSQIRRFTDLIGIEPKIKSDITCKDMKWIYDNDVGCVEKERLSRLEMLDELEELNLINSHYCLIVAKWGM